MTNINPLNDLIAYNAASWDAQVARLDPFTVPVSPEIIAQARTGAWSIKLTPNSIMPHHWVGDPRGQKILCLAGGGGQQGPILAAAGAIVTVCDVSSGQLARDQEVADREHLNMTLIQCDMSDLSAISSQSFDMIINPLSVCFVPDVHPVWRACARVLKPGGRLATAFLNPIVYTFDKHAENCERQLIVRHPLPWSDITSMTDAERARYTSYFAPMEFSHTLTDLIGGQATAGLRLMDMYEDKWGQDDIVDRYFHAFIATLSYNNS